MSTKVRCSCGLPAKLIVSMNRNPFRLFYNCPRGEHNQCGFRKWFDETLPTDDRHKDQINLISRECIQLQNRINEIKKERDQERSLWFNERSELNSQISAGKEELNKIKGDMSMSSPEDSDMSSAEDSEMSSSENSEVLCFCGRLAKEKYSMTPKNPGRLFYCCPKRRGNQCGFFQWYDEPIPTGDRRVDEMNLISSERNRLQERIDKINEEQDNERSRWNREKRELQWQLSDVKGDLEFKLENDKLDKIKSEIELKNDELEKIKNEIKLKNDELFKIKSEIKLQNDELNKIKSAFKVENESGFETAPMEGETQDIGGFQAGFTDEDYVELTDIIHLAATSNIEQISEFYKSGRENTGDSVKCEINTSLDL